MEESKYRSIRLTVETKEALLGLLDLLEDLYSNECNDDPTFSLALQRIHEILHHTRKKIWSNQLDKQPS